VLEVVGLGGSFVPAEEGDDEGDDEGEGEGLAGIQDGTPAVDENRLM